MVSRHTLCKSISGPMILSPARKHIYLQGHDDTLSRGTSPMNLFQHKTRLHRRSKVLLTTSKIFQSLPKSYRMRYTIVTLFAVLAWQTLEVIAVPAAVTGAAKESNTVTYVDFRCKESYNGLVDNGICRTLGVTAPDLTDCASGASLWAGSDKVEQLKKWTSQGEYESGKCAVSVYNQSKKKIKYSRAVLARWWSAASNACVYPGSAWDSAYCTVLGDKGQPSGVILVMSRKGHNKDFKANVISGPVAGS